MAILDNLTKAAKGFFVEDDGAPRGATAPAAVAAQPSPAPAPLPAAVSPAATQAEQRHLDHVASLLAGDGKDFGAYTRMVKSMAGSGLTGPLLYQTAFNAFAAVTGTNQAALLASAEQQATRLADDRDRVLQRHREKMGESPDAKAPPGPLALLQQRESQLQTEVAALTEQLAQKSQQLREIQQQAQAEKQKTQAALASYELAHAAAAADLQAHHQAAQNFLHPSPSTTSSNA